MNFNEYQEKALLTAIYPKEKALEYCTLGLCSETGEVAGKVKKIIRDKNGVLTNEDRSNIMDEMGDVLWYIATLCDTLTFTLDDCAIHNINKLQARKAKGTLQGSGDNR